VSAPRRHQGGRTRDPFARPRRDRPGREGASALGGEQIEGRNAVLELLRVERRRTHQLLVQADLDSAQVLEEILELAKEQRVPVRTVRADELDDLARSEVHQGVIARADALEPVTLDDLVASQGTPPFLLVLDGVTDPHNLGAVLRSALGAGVTGAVLPKHRSAHVTPTVAKAAAGAIEHLDIALVAGIPSALERLSRLKVWSVGLAADGDVDLDGVEVMTEPLAIVLGAEGAGLSSLTRTRCDVLARIELTGPIESLNVSAAGAVACFAVSRARRGVAGDRLSQEHRRADRVWPRDL
jgi:23S rRNA (guanosine2251-2'-O)-methyltransferase